MFNLLFNPNGRISSKAMLTGGAIIIAFGAAKNLAPYFIGDNQIYGMVSLVLSLVLAYCWVALWIKRYRDGGKSPAMCLLPIAAWIVLFIVGQFVIMGDFYGEIMSLSQEFAGDPEGLEAAMADYQYENLKPLTLKAVAYSVAVSAVILFVFNALIKHDPSAEVSNS